MRIASWQLNTLDSEAKPLFGLFVREKEGQTLCRLCLSYLIFRGASLLDATAPYARLAGRIIDYFA